jgi:hypothetical protein
VLHLINENPMLIGSLVSKAAGDSGKAAKQEIADKLNEILNPQ